MSDFEALHSLYCNWMLYVLILVRSKKNLSESCFDLRTGLPHSLDTLFGSISRS